MKTVFAILGGLLAILALGWVLVGNDLLMTKFFAPKQEQVRRETFENSKAYRDGAVQELQNMQFEYIKATEDQKPALASLIRRRAATVPSDAMPTDLYQFIRSLQ